MKSDTRRRAAMLTSRFSTSKESIWSVSMFLSSLILSPGNPGHMRARAVCLWFRQKARKSRLDDEIQRVPRQRERTSMKRSIYASTNIPSNAMVLFVGQPLLGGQCSETQSHQHQLETRLMLLVCQAGGAIGATAVKKHSRQASSVHRARQ